MTLVKQNQTGFVLVATMLFLAVLNLLIISCIEVALFETRMSQNFKNKMLAFYEAQNNLIIYEQDLLQGKINSSVYVIPSNACGVIFYKVFAEGKYGKAKSKLQSTYAIMSGESHCFKKTNIIFGRQSWREL